MKKKYVIITMVVLLVSVVVILLWHHEESFSGKYISGGETENGSATLKYQNVSMVSKFHLGEGVLIIYAQGEEKEYQLQDLMDSPDMGFENIFMYWYDKGENKIKHGIVYMDEQMKNLIVNTEEFQFVAADDDFVDLINEKTDTHVNK